MPKRKHVKKARTYREPGMTVNPDQEITTEPVKPVFSQFSPKGTKRNKGKPRKR